MGKNLLFETLVISDSSKAFQEQSREPLSGHIDLSSDDLWIILRHICSYHDPISETARADLVSLSKSQNLIPDTIEYWQDFWYDEFMNRCPKNVPISTSWRGWPEVMDVLAWRIITISYPAHGETLGRLFMKMSVALYRVDQHSDPVQLARGWKRYREGKGLFGSAKPV